MGGEGKQKSSVLIIVKDILSTEVFAIISYNEMANISLANIIVDAQKLASRVKDLDALSSALMVEAEGNNRFVESMRQFQDDMDSLNRAANNKSNADMVNRIQQQNANSSEILKENRELKVCIEDYELAMELIMQKYREHTNSKVLGSKLNFKEVYNEKLWKIIREQREKINEMAAVMQKAASIDDECDLEALTRLRLENKTLRELLQISKQFGTFSHPIRLNEHLLEEKGVQTESVVEDSADELSLSGASVENANNSSVIQLNINAIPCSTSVSVILTDTSPLLQTSAVMDNNNKTTLGNGLVVNSELVENCAGSLSICESHKLPTDLEASVRATIATTSNAGSIVSATAAASPT